jgi:hypothetical protein
MRSSIHWIAPIAIRPDIAQIWRGTGATKEWTDEEKAILNPFVLAEQICYNYFQKEPIERYLPPVI